MSRRIFKEKELFKIVLESCKNGSFYFFEENKPRIFNDNEFTSLFKNACKRATESQSHTSRIFTHNIFTSKLSYVITTSHPTPLKTNNRFVRDIRKEKINLGDSLWFKLDHKNKKLITNRSPEGKPVKGKKVYSYSIEQSIKQEPEIISKPQFRK
jgi:hypothetical protein